MIVIPCQINKTQAIRVYFSAILPDTFRTMPYRNSGFGIARSMLMTANHTTICIMMTLVFFLEHNISPVTYICLMDVKLCIRCLLKVLHPLRKLLFIVDVDSECCIK